MEFNKKYGNGKRFEREKMNNWKRKSSSNGNGKFEIACLQSSKNSQSITNHPSDIPLQLGLWACIHISLLTIGMGQAHPAHY
jgi:hypothetical protein